MSQTQPHCPTEVTHITRDCDPRVVVVVEVCVFVTVSSVVDFYCWLVTVVLCVLDVAGWWVVVVYCGVGVSCVVDRPYCSAQLGDCGVVLLFDIENVLTNI